MSPDPNNPTAEKYHSFVLRKFKKSKMNLSDIVKKGTLSDNMARTLALCPAGGLTFFTVGPTASGKTTTNNAILQAVPATTRTVLIQNPSEIDLRFKDSTGRVYNDVLHLEASEKENPTANDPTMENIMDHTLRLSPTFVSFGEIRSNREFKQCMKILQAGHPVNSTYHAESPEGAISRFLTAYLSESGNEPSHLALATIVGLVNIIVVQKIMRDDKRRIIYITEVLGVDPENNNKPLLNDLYRFDITGEPEYDSNGNVKKINGRHRRVGVLSERTQTRLQLEGVAKSRYDFLVKDVDENEIEYYTGENIDKYGM
jgi:pilus assembly protein CpaF